jgi:hypothetical protein
VEKMDMASSVAVRGAYRLLFVDPVSYPQQLLVAVEVLMTWRDYKSDDDI